MMSPFKAERGYGGYRTTIGLAEPSDGGPSHTQAETWQKIDKAVMEARNEAAAAPGG